MVLTLALKIGVYFVVGLLVMAFGYVFYWRVIDYYRSRYFYES